MHKPRLVVRHTHKVVKHGQTLFYGTSLSAACYFAMAVVKSPDWQGVKVVPILRIVP